jgi:tetratricopeptide (TPR) repeat protein
MPYQNKLINLISLKEYKRAINVADSGLKIKPIPEITTANGFLLQKTGNLAAAKQSYLKALNDSQASYNSNPSVSALINITYL